MGICASKPKTKEIDVSNAPETHFIKEKSILENLEKVKRIESESDYSQRSQDLRTDEEKVFSQQGSVLESGNVDFDGGKETIKDRAIEIAVSLSDHALTLNDLEARLKNSFLIKTFNN